MSRTFRKSEYLYWGEASIIAYVEKRLSEDFEHYKQRGIIYVQKDKEVYEQEKKEAENKYRLDMKKYEERLAVLEKLGYVFYKKDGGCVWYVKREYNKYGCVPIFHKTDMPYVKRVEKEVPDIFDMTWEEYRDKHYKETYEYYAKWLRDGKGSYRTGRNHYFTKLNNTFRRNKTKEKINRMMKNIDEWDDMVFETNKDGKKFIWSVW